MKKQLTANRKTTRWQKTPLPVVLLRLVFQLLGPVFPRLLGWVAFKRWFATYRFKAPKREQQWLTDAHQQRYRLNGFDIMTYHWCEDNNAPLVVLMHGWNGRGGQMGAFAKPLLEAGYQVMAFDAPGHGQSQGNSTTIFEMQQVLSGLQNRFGEFHAIIAHSFGGMACVLSLNNGLVAKKMVCIASPVTMQYLVDSFCHSMKITGRLKQNLEQRIRQRFGNQSLQQLSADHNSQQLGHVEAMIIHDRQDPYVPLSQSELLHNSWPNSHLHVTEGLGHQRLLYHKPTLHTVTAFIVRNG